MNKQDRDDFKDLRTDIKGLSVSVARLEEKNKITSSLFGGIGGACAVLLTFAVNLLYRGHK